RSPVPQCGAGVPARASGGASASPPGLVTPRKRTHWGIACDVRVIQAPALLFGTPSRFRGRRQRLPSRACAHPGNARRGVPSDSPPVIRRAYLFSGIRADLPQEEESAPPSRGRILLPEPASIACSLKSKFLGNL